MQKPLLYFCGKRLKGKGKGERGKGKGERGKVKGERENTKHAPPFPDSARSLVEESRESFVVD
ncbi:hypothetical protein VF14_25170 [Nostoc linckia z18]|uniref:Uncharacterized protein n=2 Tax=Nostoc linckia TaxID=92942 RepID=A0A9Q5Z8C6_NOSLI|nr:hypothetical protein VF03_32110 [Nostoc linckia z2]PHJ65709.1 hypothetical protein VF02_10015 [Nostoc linckia z1]PHJ70502.1 hypothetical protein VF05_10410 [Nostoc linckia z3]PHJ83433.1 hypothetical protein VF06_13255 [Nostoc linckia z4]PHJ86740.1 hypothetical protein VF07_21600 [Nostoc linckia z6]PHJ99246.1 hypothetical protein VF08_25635 [Nostoc linckia z8]PHK00520.1 hypothetical protein VF04_02765 [Nostoc linckia z7]PHK07652.1 hypothetical protein VF09_23180 [Nostoc linckia z9]PHK1741